MFSLLFAPYFLILLLDINDWFKLLLAVLTGIGMAGVGMNVMHDGNHGSFSKHKWVNTIMGSSIYILAGNVFNWKVQHNVLTIPIQMSMDMMKTSKQEEFFVFRNMPNGCHIIVFNIYILSCFMDF